MGTWGMTQIVGALHEVSDVGVSGRGGRPRETDLGFAVAGYLGVNLPMIAAGDAAWLVVTYTQGAVAYLNGGQSSGSDTTTFGANSPLFNAQFGGVPLVEAFINARGRLELTEALSIAGGLRHYWVPDTLRSNFFGSWLHTDYGNGANFARVGAGPFTGTRFGYVDFDEVIVGGNLIWSPIGRGFDIGAEIIYKNIRFDEGRGIIVQRAAVSAGPGAGPIRRVDYEDAFEGRVRVQRDF